MVDGVSRAQDLELRKKAVEAKLRAISELPLLLEVCTNSNGDMAETRTAVAERFRISDWEAEVMLSMQVSRFTPVSVEELRAELAEVTSAIEELR